MMGVGRHRRSRGGEPRKTRSTPKKGREAEPRMKHGSTRMRQEMRRAIRRDSSCFWAVYTGVRWNRKKMEPLGKKRRRDDDSGEGTSDDRGSLPRARKSRAG